MFFFPRQLICFLLFFTLAFLLFALCLLFCFWVFLKAAGNVKKASQREVCSLPGAANAGDTRCCGVGVALNQLLLTGTYLLTAECGFRPCMSGCHTAEVEKLTLGRSLLVCVFQVAAGGFPRDCKQQLLWGGIMHLHFSFVQKAAERQLSAEWGQGKTMVGGEA